MRRRTLGVKKEPTIMIIPMIDIVFFLLVFFMVGTLYMNTEQQIPLNLPSASTSTAKSIEPITITLTTTKFLRNAWRKRYALLLNKHRDKPLLSVHLRMYTTARLSLC